MENKKLKKPDSMEGLNVSSVKKFQLYHYDLKKKQQKSPASFILLDGTCDFLQFLSSAIKTSILAVLTALPFRTFILYIHFISMLTNILGY